MLLQLQLTMLEIRPARFYIIKIDRLIPAHLDLSLSQPVRIDSVVYRLFSESDLML
jgi:hypothetical protein